MRVWLGVLLCWLGFSTGLVWAQSPRVITSDWTVAETLMALQHPPLGVGDKRAYERWVIEPRLPSSSVDLGLRTQPNIELVLSLRPDYVVNAEWLQQALPDLPSIGKKINLEFYTPQGHSWAQSVAATRQLGALVQRPQAAEALITQTQTQLRQQGLSLQKWRDRPLAIVQFIDARHLRIYGDNSLFGTVLRMMSLTNAWPTVNNAWGGEQIDLTQLAKLPANTLMVIVAPYPPHMAKQVGQNKLWQRLPFGQPQRVVTLPAVWSFGGLPAMGRFAEVLTQQLRQQGDQP
ncbi:MAG: ABC transporter substrate-binding protein [Neisseriaceae bacterium]|nr:ABC transporter substrate-binding protein [Neisseriaceae bacterium]MBP6861744.1 ABC transporter substrate-binding protein [Neisseriaceae bacterium]